MKRPGYNPTRRNRNIGTESSGFGQNNRLVIPWAWADDRIYYNRLVNPVDVEIKVRSVTIHVVVEPPLNGFAHACTVHDISRLLLMLPLHHIKDIKAIVLRQPKRKERILMPVWGRLVYWTDVCGHSGPTVYLEAQNASRVQEWGKSLTPEYVKELDRLRNDGHKIETDKRKHLIHSTTASIRNTQLYRTLPHEIGHYVDYLTKVEDPSRNDRSKWSALNDKYHSRPSSEKESFAHRYADEFRQKLIDDGLLPFERDFDPKKIKKMGLDPLWFELTDAA
jgi:hypothetical protein